ncbi:MAG: 50S ribosomal protein L22 [Lentisphaeria bacterium]|jgi:large subunit ribosomal protein L22
MPVSTVRGLALSVPDRSMNKQEDSMEKLAISKNVRISPFKAREVARLIQGRPAVEALDMLSLIPRKAARLIEKTLKSAIANAENAEPGSDPSVRPVDRSLLIVKEAVIGEGPTLKRFLPKARGSAGRIRKRTSHIRIAVTDQE